VRLSCFAASQLQRVIHTQKSTCLPKHSSCLLAESQGKLSGAVQQILLCFSSRVFSAKRCSFAVAEYSPSRCKKTSGSLVPVPAAVSYLGEFPGLGKSR
jgi:hypothetical protein